MAGGIWGSTDSDHIYKHIRSEIQHEQSLMNVRVNWLIASQAFLFVPLAIGIDPRQSPRSVAHSLFFPFIPYLGMVLCTLALVGIIAAVWRVESWKPKAVYCDDGGEGEHDTFSMVLNPSSQRLSLRGIAPLSGIPLFLLLRLVMATYIVSIAAFTLGYAISAWVLLAINVAAYSSSGWRHWRGSLLRQTGCSGTCARTRARHSLRYRQAPASTRS